MAILDAIECLAEAAADQGIPSLVIAILVETDAEVDQLYRELGVPKGIPLGRIKPPFEDFAGSEECGIWQRTAQTVVMGATVTISGPHRISRRRAA